MNALLSLEALSPNNIISWRIFRKNSIKRGESIFVMARIGKNTRKILWVTSSGYCPLCDTKMTNKGCPTVDNFATVDHIIPLSKNGHSNIENLRLICRRCNIKRGNVIEADHVFYQDNDGRYIIIS